MISWFVWRRTSAVSCDSGNPAGNARSNRNRYGVPGIEDGKFNLYHLGKFAIEPTTILWVHWSWLLSIGIDCQR